MTKQNLTIYFPWKTNKNKFKIEQEIPTLFNFLNLTSSISIFDHKNSILGIKIEPKSKTKFPISLKISISIKSNDKKKTEEIKKASSDVLFTEDCKSQTLYPGIFISEINDYLFNENEKSTAQSLKVDFSFSLIDTNNEKSKKSKDKSSESLDEYQYSSSNVESSSSEKKLQKSKKTKKTSTTEKNSESEVSTCQFCGLANQGATCYMNSAIQSLFHIPLFRARIFKFNTGLNEQDLLKKPTKNDKEQSGKIVIFNIQLLFYQMMNFSKNKSNSSKYLSTIPLTDSFGWSKEDVSMQQDVQEFIRTFFTQIDEITKPPKKEKTKNLYSGDDDSITGMFKGKMATTISLESTGEVVSRTYEDTYDFSLPVKGITNIKKSFDRFSMKESFENNENFHGTRVIQTQFAVLPKILHIHLRRFVYSQKLCRVDKLNTYFSYTDTIDLEPYMCQPCEITKQKKRKSKTFRKSKKIEEITTDDDEDDFTYTGSFKYILCGVIVHEGELSSSGHYYCYIKLISNDEKHNQWYLFNDTCVRKASAKEAIDDNFGHNQINSNLDSNASAYILVYVREDAIDEVFNIKDSEISIPKNIINYFNTDSKSPTSDVACSIFDNKESDKTIGFTLINENCVRANCKLGRAGIDNRALCERVNVPLNKIFDINGQKIGGLYASIAMYLNASIDKIRLRTITSSYEIKNLLNPSDFEITPEMNSAQISELKSRMESVISPRIIFVEQGQDKNQQSSISFITKLYTRDLRLPMIYTGIISCESNEVKLKDLIEIYKNKLKAMITDKHGIDEAKFHAYIEVKTSNISNNATIRKLNSQSTLRGNSIPNGSFLIFTINDIDEKIINELITKNEKMMKNIKIEQSKDVIKYSDVMIKKCPDDPIEYIAMFTNTKIITLSSYKDNTDLGTVEVPLTFNFTQLSEFLQVQFHVDYDQQKQKMIFFGDGPAMRPIERNLLDNVKKNIYFLIVDKDYQYSESCYTLMVQFSADAVSLYSQFNFFIETVSSDNEEDESTEFNSIEDIIKSIITIYNEKENVKLSHQKLRCFWMSKDNRQIVSDFIKFHSSKKKSQSKTLINEYDVVILNRMLRVEIIPKNQLNSMKSLKKSSPNYSIPRLEVYKSYVDDYDEADPALHAVDFPFILMNIKANENVKKLKDEITQFLQRSKDTKSSENFSVKYASLFIPKLDDNLIEKNGDEIIDYQFIFDVENILKNEENIKLEKNQPNKLFLVYSRDRALFKTSEGVIFH